MCGWVWLCVIGQNETEKRNEKRQTIDTQRFGVFRFYSVFIPFSVPFGGVIGGGFRAMGLCGAVVLNKQARLWCFVRCYANKLNKQARLWCFVRC